MNQSPINNSTVFKQQVGFAMRLCELEEYSQAEAFLRSILRKQPKNSQIWYLLSYVAARQKQLIKAADLAEKAIKLNPQEVSYYSTLANIYTNQKQFAKAIECYQKAITLQPQNANLYQNLGFIYSIEGDIAAASFNYGVAQQLEKNFPEAIKYYQKAIKAQPDYIKAYYCLGYLYRKSEDYDRAIECYQKIIQYERENPEAHYNLGLVYQEQGAFARAIYNYEQAIRYKPDYGDAHLNLSVLYKKQGNLDKAFEACQKAIQYQAQAANSFAPLGDITPDKAKPPKKIPLKQEIVETSELESLQPQPEVVTVPEKIREIAPTETVDNPLETTSLITEDKEQQGVVETEFTENTESVLEGRFVSNKSIFKTIEKELVEERILNNNYNFILVTFLEEQHSSNILTFQEQLSKIEISYCLYQIPETNLSFKDEKYINTDYTKPSIFTSIYNTLLTEQSNYDRDKDFTHILYVDFRSLSILKPTLIDELQKICDRNIDLALDNGLQHKSVQSINNFQIEPYFLTSSSVIQLYSLTQKSLLVWQIWQEIITNYMTSDRAKQYQLYPGDEAFLDYAWNNFLYRNSDIKYSWLEQQYLNYYWTPLGRNLIS